MLRSSNDVELGMPDGMSLGLPNRSKDSKSVSMSLSEVDGLADGKNDR